LCTIISARQDYTQSMSCYQSFSLTPTLWGWSLNKHKSRLCLSQTRHRLQYAMAMGHVPCEISNFFLLLACVGFLQYPTCCSRFIYFRNNYLKLRVCCFKLYLLIPVNKMIKIHISMFVTSLLNFIPRYKMFQGIEKFSQEKGWE